ncbi:MAG: uroporphyrinogen decarboxylase [Planctomycetaceae bacterium]|nr:uroporphyrinogen decarboxylase [Planctomycetaceae bacterium]
MSNPTLPLNGLRVAAFESRFAAEMARLIERTGAEPHVSASLREVPLTENPDAVDFAHRLISGEIDIVILMTGVGTKHLVTQIERHVDRQRFLNCLTDITTIARGPKPVAALRELGITPTVRIGEPNTWRDVLKTIDQGVVQVSNQSVVVQEYGLPNASLIAGLEARGATVRSIKVYNWDLPVDCGPLEENVRAIAAGERDVVLFTSAHQVVNVLRVADRLGIVSSLRQALRRTLIGSIGPTTSEMLVDCDLQSDFEPQHAKMGQLVQATAERAVELLAEKRRRAVWFGTTTPSTEAQGDSAIAPSGKPAWYDSLFMKACRQEPVSRTPIWLMRQAGRYLPEYREVRARTTFLELCKNPALCAEVMLTTVNRLGVDAAIIFSDLLPMLEPMGIELEFAHGEGPVIHNPVRTAQDVDRVLELEELGGVDFVMETVRQTRDGLAADLPVIGFAGAPFTLASYVIEGGSSRNYLLTKQLMYRDQGAWDALLGKLSRSVARYLNGQIAAGAQVVQLFDSWVGCLGPDDYRRFVLPHVQALIECIPADVPVIHFGTGNPALLPLQAQAGGTVVGVDWRIRLDEGWKLVGHDRGVQGNLDPLVLFANRGEIRRQAASILEQAGGRPGHIFNLGHGILPQTPVENVLALIEAVKELSAR